MPPRTTRTRTNERRRRRSGRRRQLWRVSVATGSQRRANRRAPPRSGDGDAALACLRDADLAARRRARASERARVRAPPEERGALLPSKGFRDQSHRAERSRFARGAAPPLLADDAAHRLSFPFPPPPLPQRPTPTLSPTFSSTCSLCRAPFPIITTVVYCDSAARAACAGVCRGTLFSTLHGRVCTVSSPSSHNTTRASRRSLPTSARASAWVAPPARGAEPRATARLATFRPGVDSCRGCGRARLRSAHARVVGDPSMPNNRAELLKTCNQLHATRGRVESYRIMPVDSQPVR